MDLFVERRERTPGVELLVRAKTNRILGKDDKLFDKVRKSSAQGKRVIEVKRLSARIKASKQAARAVRPERQATVELRYLKAKLPAKGKAPVEMTIVHVREKAPPPDAERWFLLTTLPVCRRCRTHPDMVRPALADRRLFQGPEVRLQGTREPDGRAPRRRLAHPPDDPSGTARTAARDHVLGHRTPSAGAVRQILPRGAAEKPWRRRLPGRPPRRVCASGTRQARK